MTELTKEKAIDMYRTLWEVRLFEEKASALYRDGELPGFIHLSLGQEACAVGACAALEPDDYITSTHRGHGHCLAKGADPGRMMAELWARHQGYSKGRGGSMHIADVAAGVLGANGIVGQSAPLAIGAALTAQVKGLGRVALAFFGEGASGAGPVHEAMNIAALWKLPVVFFCEVNQRSELSTYETHVPISSVAARASGYGFDGVTVDGADTAAVYQAVKEAADKARNGGGPSLVEAKTLRWHGHYEGDPQKYLTKEELDPARRRDPIAVFADSLTKDFEIGEDALSAVRARAEAHIDEAVEYARGLQSPPASVMLEDVYA